MGVGGTAGECAHPHVAPAALPHPRRGRGAVVVGWGWRGWHPLPLPGRLRARRRQLSPPWWRWPRGRGVAGDVPPTPLPFPTGTTSAGGSAVGVVGWRGGAPPTGFFLPPLAAGLSERWWRRGCDAESERRWRSPQQPHACLGRPLLRGCEGTAGVAKQVHGGVFESASYAGIAAGAAGDGVHAALAALPAIPTGPTPPRIRPLAPPRPPPSPIKA